MTIRQSGIWEIGVRGSDTFVGTSEIKADLVNKRLVSQSPNEYFYGQISNSSNIPFYIMIKLMGVDTLHTRYVRTNERIDIRGLSIEFITILLNGTAKILGAGTLVTVDNDEDYSKLLASGIGIFYSIEKPHVQSPLYEHTDIATATTTTIATPAAGKILSPYHVNVAVDGACTVTLIWTDSAGANPKTIMQMNFGGVGFFIKEFGNDGVRNPLGADGLLKVITSAAVNIDVDVNYADVEI